MLEAFNGSAARDDCIRAAEERMQQDEELMGGLGVEDAARCSASTTVRGRWRRLGKSTSRLSSKRIRRVLCCNAPSATAATAPRTSSYTGQCQRRGGE
eukprot:3856117-Pyramimonas_sp.AAC.1